MASMEGKVIAITGGASGIGLATAKVLSSRGAILCLADNRAEPLAAAVKTIQSGKVSTAVVDTRNAKQVNDWIAGIVKEHGKLDGAANLAGVIGPNMGKLNIADMEDPENKEWEFVMGVNATGVYNCLRAELRAMASNPGSAIVNAASVAGLMGSPGAAPYCASKHAVIGLTRTAAKEVGSKKIRVNAIAPGIIDTPMVDALEVQRATDLPLSVAALDRKGDPAEVGRLIAFLLSEEASFISGSVYQVDGAWVC